MTWFTAIPGAIKWGSIAVMVIGLIGSAWGVVNSIRKAEANRLIAEQLQRAIRDKDAAIAEKNRIVARFMALPDARLRLCVQRDPFDGCCKPEPAKCEP